MVGSLSTCVDLIGLSSIVPIALHQREGEKPVVYVIETIHVSNVLRNGFLAYALRGINVSYDMPTVVLSVIMFHPRRKSSSVMYIGSGGKSFTQVDYCLFRRIFP